MVCVGIIGLVSAMASSSAPVMTVDEYVTRVVTESPDARLLEIDVLRARRELGGAGAWPNPSLQWQREAGLDADEPRQDVVSLTLPLVLSGRLGLEEDAAEL